MRQQTVKLFELCIIRSQMCFNFNYIIERGVFLKVAGSLVHCNISETVQEKVVVARDH